MYGKTNAGGGSSSFATASDAILKVTTPASAVVSVTKGGLSIAGNSWYSSDTLDNKVHLFTVKQSLFDGVNPWIVSSTVNSETKSTNVTINAARMFETNLLYRIPLEYQEVAYLESVGDAYYINTGIATNTIGSITIIGRITDSMQYIPLFGANNATSKIDNSATFAYVPYDGHYYVDNNGFMSAAAIGANTDFEATFTISNSLITATVNESTTTQAGSIGTITNKNLWLFTNNYNNTYISGTTIKARISSVQIRNRSDELIADYVPCYRKSDNVPGFYDLAISPIGGVFKTKSGTASTNFIYP